MASRKIITIIKRASSNCPNFTFILFCYQSDMVEYYVIHTGALKMLDVKMQDVKQTDGVAGHEIAGHENTEHENAGHENARRENAGHLRRRRHRCQQSKHVMPVSSGHGMERRCDVICSTWINN